MVIILLFIAVLSTLCKGGRPPALHEENHPNWIPTVNMGYATDVADDARYSRLQQRRRKQSERESEERQTENSDCPSSSVDTGTVGRISDKEITEQSGIMKSLLPGIINSYSFYHAGIEYIHIRNVS